MYGEIEVDTDGILEAHAEVTCCVKTIYHGYSGVNYWPTIYYTQVKFRICEDYLTIDTSKAFYYEKVYEYNSGTYTDTTMKTLGFQNIYDPQYCGL